MTVEADKLIETDKVLYSGLKHITFNNSHVVAEILVSYNKEAAEALAREIIAQTQKGVA